MKSIKPNADELAQRLLAGVRGVQKELGWTGAAPSSIHDRFADVLDSMGLVEFLLQVAEDSGTTPEEVEQCVERQFGTIAELATAMCKAGLIRGPAQAATLGPAVAAEKTPVDSGCWIAATAVTLPAHIQAAEEIDAVLQRPAGWLRKRAGIESRHLWEVEDPLVAAADVGRQCLAAAGLRTGDVRTLLVTSEAPPQLLGLAAALQHRLGLPAGTPALEIGGACTGFLAALWLGRQMMSRTGPVLIIAVEAPSRLLKLEPGAAGEAAALFGDGAAACALCDRAVGTGSVPVIDAAIGADGSGAHLLAAERTASSVVLRMQGPALAERAIRVMAEKGRALLQNHRLPLADVQAIVAHGGNGRMPGLLARKLDCAAEKMWSETAHAGNLGSATLPAAWAARGPCTGQALWLAVGAGLTWGTALTG